MKKKPEAKESEKTEPTKIPLPFDVILVRGRGFASNVARIFQPIWGPRRFSHVILCLGSGTAMDAVYPRVRMKRLLEVWNSPKYLPEKKVLRHLKVNQAISKMVADGESDPSKRGDAVLGKILNSAQTFHGGKYSFFFGIPKKWIKKALPGEPWFCSELAAEALRELKVTEGLPAPHRTWPGHFERLKTDNAAPWLDVTDTVRQYLCSVAEGKEVGQNPRPEQEIAKTIYKFSEADFGHFKSMVVTNEEFSRLIESAKEIMDSNMNVLTQFIEWAQKKKKG